MRDTIPAPPVPSNSPNAQWQRDIEAVLSWLKLARERAERRMELTNGEANESYYAGAALAYSDAFVQVKRLID